MGSFDNVYTPWMSSILGLGLRSIIYINNGPWGLMPLQYIYIYIYICAHPKCDKQADSTLGSQFIYDVVFGFPTLVDSYLEIQQQLSDFRVPFSLYSCDSLLLSILSSPPQPFNHPHFPLLSHIYSQALVEGLWLPSELVQQAVQYRWS